MFPSWLLQFSLPFSLSFLEVPDVGTMRVNMQKWLIETRTLLDEFFFADDVRNALWPEL